MPEEGLMLRFRLRTFSAFAGLAVGVVLLYALWVFGRLVLDGVRDWRLTFVVCLLIVILLSFTYLVPWNMYFVRNLVVVRYLIGRTARFDLRDMSDWKWWSNTVGNSGLRIHFKNGSCLTIPPMFVDDRLPSILNSHLITSRAQ